MAHDLNLFFFINGAAGRFHIADLLIIFLGEYFPYIFIGLFLLLVLRAKKKGPLFWIPVISAVIARLGIVPLIRFFYHRPRPFMIYHVHQLITDNTWSFPSGHATFFFALAAGTFFFNKSWGIGFFVAAFLVSLGRVAGGVHYPSDILAGMIIGTVTAWIVHWFFEKKPRSIPFG